jgi:hypothetical protein
MAKERIYGRDVADSLLLSRWFRRCFFAVPDRINRVISNSCALIRFASK